MELPCRLGPFRVLSLELRVPNEEEMSEGATYPRPILITSLVTSYVSVKPENGEETQSIN
jgi:hypothetical protein